MTTLYLIRGVSGSGKTTLARKMAEDLVCRYIEADQWFIRGDGEYIFDAKELPRAHRWCFDEAAANMETRVPVIVSNTFTRLWEMRNYIDLALEKGYAVKIITCTGRYQNVHGLTEEMVAKQEARFQSNADIAKELKYDWNRYGKIVYVNH